MRLETSNPARHTPVLTTFLQPEHHEALRQGLSDPHYHGPALAAVLHWEATRTGGNHELVNGLMEAGSYGSVWST